MIRGHPAAETGSGKHGTTVGTTDHDSRILSDLGQTEAHSYVSKGLAATGFAATGLAATWLPSLGESDSGSASYLLRLLGTHYVFQFAIAFLLLPQFLSKLINGEL